VFGGVTGQDDYLSKFRKGLSNVGWGQRPGRHLFGWVSYSEITSLTSETNGGVVLSLYSSGRGWGPSLLGGGWGS